MNSIQNPILRGFNPDPSIIRVHDDYYIATSTFEWFPGVQIHHSKDLVNWKLVARPLNRLSQLDMKGVPDSCGVWAPCLSYDDGTFYLIYSNVKSFAGVWKDTPNYLVTTNDILGDWSEPIFIDASGFDGSLFHDDDGKKYFLSMRIDHRKSKLFGGIILQEFDEKTGKLVGKKQLVFEGTEFGLTEGPHLYKKDGYYYLITAEGGTEYGHVVSMARAKNIEGTYEVSPRNPLVSCRDFPEYYLQKSGHGDLVQTPDGKWLIVFLTGRPLSPNGFCILGRETSIETLIWNKNDWPILSSQSSLPRIQVELPSNASLPQNLFQFIREDFDAENLNSQFQSLRVPISEEWVSLSIRKGFLCLKGRESLSSLHNQSLIARRVQSLNIEVSTSLDFSPNDFQQMAGLVCYYNTGHFHYLSVSADDDGKRCLQIITHNNFEHIEVLDEPIVVQNEGSIFLKLMLYGADLQFYFSLDNKNWHTIGGILDAAILSDDYVREVGMRYQPAFTGTFVGLCCQDLTGNYHPAYFDWFEYKEGEFAFTSNMNHAILSEMANVE
jgi:xylan 1,4-beta-xylosidase